MLDGAGLALEAGAGNAAGAAAGTAAVAGGHGGRDPRLADAWTLPDAVAELDLRLAARARVYDFPRAAWGAEAQPAAAAAAGGGGDDETSIAAVVAATSTQQFLDRLRARRAALHGAGGQRSAVSELVAAFEAQLAAADLSRRGSGPADEEPPAE